MRKGLVATLAVAVCLALGGVLRAAEERLHFGHLTIQDGLSNNWVLAILKDSHGFLWFGTQDGLSRYDGAGFKVYRHDPNDPGSLPSSVAGVLYEDAQKRLWVGSHQGNEGVALYDREHDRFKTFRPNPGQPRGNGVRAITQDSHGQIWLGTENGIASLDPDSGKIRRYPLLPDDQVAVLGALVSALFEDSRGRLWVGASGGLMRFDRERGEYIRWQGAASDLNGLHRADIQTFCADNEGRLWIGTLGSGLHRFDTETGRDDRYLPDPRNPHSISVGRMRRILFDGKSTLYVGTENGGLSIFDIRSGEFRSFLPDIDDDASLNTKSIWSLCLDDQGTLWMGTFNGGVNFLSPFLQRFQYIRAGRGKLDDPHVSSVLEDHQGTLWIGTDGGGLNRLDPRTGAFSYYRSDPDDPTTIGSDAVWALLEDGRRNLWLGGWAGGLGLLDRASGRVTRFRHDPNDPRSLISNDIWRILELRSGELLIVTHGGVDLFDQDKRTFTHLTDLYPSAAENVIYSAAEDGQGNLWIVGATFVEYLDRRTRQVTRYRNPTSLGSGWTQAVLIDSQGNVWLGTSGGLSCVKAGTRQWLHYTKADGLSSDTIVGIIEDASGNLWVSTTCGLDKISDAVRVPAKPTILNFDSRDGLQSQEFARNACFRSPSGRLYFGGARGLNFFQPERVVPNTQPPSVALTGLRIANKTVRPGDPHSPLKRAIDETQELTLSPTDTVVTFEFAALSCVLPLKNKYRYKLVGFDESWNDVGSQHTATYTNLPWRKDFTFRVQASNNDGVWNEEGVALKVYVTPRWYGQPLTWVLAAVALVAAAFGAYRVRVGSLKQRERELAQRVEEKTADLQREIAEHKLTEQRLETERDLRHALMERQLLADERTRMARELHDSLAQNFAGLSLQLEAVAADLPPGASEPRASLDIASRMLRHCQTEARRTVWDLRSSIVESAPFKRALEQALAPLIQAGKPHIEVEVDPEDATLRPQMQRDVVRIAEEAVTNAVKHAAASLVSVACRIRVDAVWLEVHDDGHGFEHDDDAPPNADQFGLLGMRERAARIGARLEIETRPGAGTWVILRCPEGLLSPRLKARRGRLQREDRLDNLGVPSGALPEDEAS